VSAESVTPPQMVAGLGRAVPVIPTPLGPVASEVRTIVRIAGDDETAAALLRQLGQLLSYVPPLTLLKLLSRWVARLQDLGTAGEGAMLRIIHRLSRGKHKALDLITKETIR
jgi:hypothetical protein